MEGVSCSQPTSTVASSAWVGRTWPTRKRKTNYSETMWPKRVKEEEANVISAQREGLWASVESVTISGKQLEYREQKDCEYNLILCNSLFEITSAQGTATLACKPLREELFLKAKFLYEEVLAFSNMEKATDYTLRTYARKARPAEPDSEDEDIPEPAIVPAFDETELVIVNSIFKHLFTAYERALVLGLFNCVGKAFVDALGEYADLCTRLDVTSATQFLYLHSTAKGPPQPVATIMKWSLPKRVTANTSNTSVPRNSKKNERYADNVLYDSKTFINVVVSEVKEREDTPSEAQNNEQMLGLWKGSQKAMLGLELAGHCVQPKVLSLQEGRLTMYYLKELDLAEPKTVKSLVKLLTAFLLCVEYCLEAEPNETEGVTVHPRS